MELHSNLPKNLVDTDVTSVEVTGPFRVRVTHRGGTSAVHQFHPAGVHRHRTTAADLRGVRDGRGDR